MSRNWLFSGLCIATAVVFAPLASAGHNLSVNESATRCLVQDQTLVELKIKQLLNYRSEDSAFSECNTREVSSAITTTVLQTLSWRRRFLK